MSTRAYTILGWLVWRIAKFEFKHNRAKLGAGATVLGVLVVGLLAAKASSDDD
jgi:hypothetical protein